MKKNIVSFLLIICIFLSACNNSGGGSGPEPEAERPYKVGDTGPGGGIVFYDDTIGFDFDDDGIIQSDEKDLLDGINDGVVSGSSFLEAAPPFWNGTDNPDPEALWGLNNINTLVPDVSWNPTPDECSQSVGRGKSNTDILITALTNNGESGKAAQLCKAYNGGGETDWFFPSVGELYLMCIVLNGNTPVLGGFFNSSTGYLSSSEYNSASAIIIAFMDTSFNGNPFYTAKDTSPARYVRPTRSF